MRWLGPRLTYDKRGAQPALHELALVSSTAGAAFRQLKAREISKRWIEYLERSEAAPEHTRVVSERRPKTRTLRRENAIADHGSARGALA